MSEFVDGIGLDSVVEDYEKNGWNIEKNKSSEIEIIPGKDIIRKTKKRRIDKLVYEAFTTIFTNTLLNQYDSLFSHRGFTLYSPESLRMEYETDGEPYLSSLYQFFCPGKALNHLKNRTGRHWKVGQEKGRQAQRVMYLSGILNEVFKREGVIHNDQGLRHYFLLPRDGHVHDYYKGGVHERLSLNGIATIDVENLRLEGPYSRNVLREAAEMQREIRKKFDVSEGIVEYFHRGRSVVEEIPREERFATASKEIARQRFKNRFTGIHDVDLDQQEVYYE